MVCAPHGCGRVLVAVARASVAHSAPVQAQQLLAAVPAVKGNPRRDGGVWWRAKSSAGVTVHAIALEQNKAGSRQPAPAKAAPRQSGVCRSVPGMSPHGQRCCLRGGGPQRRWRSSFAAQSVPLACSATSNAEHNGQRARPRARRVPASAFPANERRNKMCVCRGVFARAGPSARVPRNRQQRAAQRR